MKIASYRIPSEISSIYYGWWPKLSRVCNVFYVLKPMVKLYGIFGRFAINVDTHRIHSIFLLITTNITVLKDVSMKVLVISERDVSTGWEDNATTFVRGWYNIFTIVVAYGNFLSVLCTYLAMMPSLIADAVRHALAFRMQRMNLLERKSMFNNECF